MSKINELPIPPQAKKAESATELVRVWVVNGEPHVSIASGIWEDPGAWGILLVDLARHLGNAYEQTTGIDKDEVFARIKAALDAEWISPTDEPSGHIES